MNEEKNKNLRQKIVKIIIYIITYTIFLGYPILVLNSCEWSSASWGVTWCDLELLENTLSDIIFGIVIFSAFLLWIPIIIYVLFVTFFWKFINFLVWKIFFDGK